MGSTLSLMLLSSSGAKKGSVSGRYSSSTPAIVSCWYTCVGRGGGGGSNCQFDVLKRRHLA